MAGAFHIPFPSPGAGRRIAIFHHAGGSGLSFLRLARALAPTAEVLLGELPGRGRRHREAPPHSLESFAQEAAGSLLALDDKPLTLYGHSMGCLAAYETALALPASVSLEKLVVSSCRAPGRSHGPAPLRDPGELSDPFLLQLMEGYGPIPKELKSPEALAYFLPLFRKDLELLRQYSPRSDSLNVPLLAIGGESDPVVTEGDLKEWSHYTAAGFGLRMRPGGHFFVFEDLPFLAGIF